MVQEILNGHDQTHGENIHMEKISRQTFTDIWNHRCDLDLECSNSTFPQDTQAHDAMLSNQVWLQTDQQFRRCSENNILIIYALTVTFTLKIVN